MVINNCNYKPFCVCAFSVLVAFTCISSVNGASNPERKVLSLLPCFEHEKLEIQMKWWVKW